jgi:DTW domain-containing protein YfiP
VRHIETATRIVLLQHPRERDVPIGTARMASLCLPMSELHVGVSVAESPALVRALRDPARPAVLLYPGEGAIDVVKNPPRGPVTLVVVDGTWSQAKKIVKNDPELARLPRYAFTPARPSEYRIRREPSDECVSTIEALMQVLGALEGDPDRFRALLEPFRAMVEMQIEHAKNKHTRHAKKPRAVPRPHPVPAILRDRAQSVVCIAGEANAWPYSAPERERFPEELVHWVALRIATGETFDAIVAPHHPLAPGTSRWVELAPDEIAAGDSLDALASKWSAFVRDDDVIVSWGRYASKIFVASGGRLASARVDLRQVARTWSRGKVGTMDDFVAAHANDPSLPALEPVARGRGGRRVAQLARITRAITSC